MANPAPANGSRSTHARVTRLQSLPGCDSTLRPSIAIGANGRRAGKLFTGRQTVLMPGTRSGCNFTVAPDSSAGALAKEDVLSRFFRCPDRMRCGQRTLQPIAATNSDTQADIFEGGISLELGC